MSINFPTNPQQGTPYSFNGVIWEWNGYAWFIKGSEADLFGFTGAGLFFPDDLNTAFGDNRSFGKYTKGEVIRAKGKTAVTVISESMVAELPPTVSITSGSTIGFNQTSISNNINTSYTINSFGASISGATLEFKRTNTSGWTLLSSSTANSRLFVHGFTDTNFNTNGFNYRYTVSDTSKNFAISTITINPATYVAPSATITQTAISATSPETNTTREKGNVLTNISASITRNSPYVQLTGWEFMYSRNGEAYQSTNFSGSVSGSPSSASTGITQHSPGNTANSVTYRVKINDAYQDSLGASVNSAAASTINFIPFIFYGPTGSTPVSSANVRSVTNRVFQDTSTFVLNTGTEYTRFVVAMPSNFTITSVIQGPFDITAAYTGNLQTIAVADYAGNTSNYNVYTASSALPYDPAVDQTVTRG